MGENKRIKDIIERNHPGMIKDLDALRMNKQINLSDQAKYDIIHKIAWEWTEGQNARRKYYGCQYWSKAALEDKLKTQFKEGEELGIKIRRSDTDRLRHEHIIPRKLFLEYIWASIEKQNSLDENRMESHFLACVITSDEDDVLNALGLRERIPLNYKEPFNNFAENFKEIEDPWARYKVAQDEAIVKKHTKGKVPLSQIYKVEWNESCNAIKSIKKFSLEE